MAILYVRNEDGEFVSVPAIVGPKGDRGEPGKDGAHGSDGKDGKDASVTTESITNALGYTPANQEVVNTLSKEMEKLSEETWTFTLEDGTTLTKKVFVNA